MNETARMEDLGIDGWVKIKRILKKQYGMVWNAFIWLTTETNSRILCTLQINFQVP